MKSIKPLIIALLLAQSAYASTPTPNAEARLKLLSEQSSAKRGIMGWTAIGIGAISMYAASTIDTDNDEISAFNTLGLLSIGAGIIALNWRSDAEVGYEKVAKVPVEARDDAARQEIKSVSDKAFVSRMVAAGICAGIGLTNNDSKIKGLWLIGSLIPLLIQSPAEDVYHAYQSDSETANTSLLPALDITKNGLTASYTKNF